MKDGMDYVPANETEAKEGFANRRLIRPTLPRTEVQGNHRPPAAAERRPERHDRMERNDRGDRGLGGGKKPAPPEQTNAENFYYQKQMQSHTPMVIVLRDGEEIHGVIEWYDKSCLKINRTSGGPNLMIYKPAIKYMYKEGEGS